MKRLWHFVKWNFTDMQPWTKRFLAYFAIGFVSAFIVEGGFFITAILLFLDLSWEIARNRYLEYLEEMNRTLDSLKETSNESET